MARQSLYYLERELEKKREKRDKKRRLKMKVSGAGVKALQRLIGKN